MFILFSILFCAKGQVYLPIELTSNDIIYNRFINYLSAKKSYEQLISRKADIDRLIDKIIGLKDKHIMRKTYIFLATNNIATGKAEQIKQALIHEGFDAKLFDPKAKETYPSQFVKKLKFTDQYYKSNKPEVTQALRNKQRILDSLNTNIFINYISTHSWPCRVYYEKVCSNNKGLLENNMGLSAFIVHQIFNNDEKSQIIRKKMIDELSRDNISFAEYIDYETKYMEFMPKIENSKICLPGMIMKGGYMHPFCSMPQIYALAKYLKDFGYVIHITRIFRSNTMKNKIETELKLFKSILVFFGAKDSQIDISSMENNTINSCDAYYFNVKYIIPKKIFSIEEW